VHEESNSLKEELTAWLLEPNDSGQSLVAWLDQNLTAEAPILATDGQMAGYILNRNTVGLPISHFSSETWEADQVQQLMRRYDIRVFLVFSHGKDTLDLSEKSSFIRGLVKGEHPNWLVQVWHSPDAKAFMAVD
jgi:hypothetical protein